MTPAAECRERSGASTSPPSALRASGSGTRQPSQAVTSELPEPDAGLGTAAQLICRVKLVPRRHKAASQHDGMQDVNSGQHHAAPRRTTIHAGTNAADRQADGGQQAELCAWLSPQAIRGGRCQVEIAAGGSCEAGHAANGSTALEHARHGPAGAASAIAEVCALFPMGGHHMISPQPSTASCVHLVVSDASRTCLSFALERQQWLNYKIC